MDYEYTVEVYAITVEDGYRTIESIPTEYREDVVKLLTQRKWEREQGLRR